MDSNPFRRGSLHVEQLDPRRMLAAINLFDMDPSVTAEDIGYTLSEPEQGAAVASASAAAAAEDEGPFAPEQIFSVNPDERLMAFYDMGGTPGQPPECRKLGFALCTRGWEWVLENFYQPVVDAGATRLLVSMPFGQRSWINDQTPAPGQVNFQFDAYLDARVEVPNQNATRNFVPAWQNFFAANRDAGVDVDAIVYIGSPRHDPDQNELINTPNAWWDRAYDIILPLLRAGFRQIGFDAAARTLPGTLDYELLDLLRYPEKRDPVRDARLINVVGMERIEVYLEAVPIRDTLRTDFPVIAIDSHFMIQDPLRPGTENDIFFEHDRFTGEIIRILSRDQWDGVDGDGNVVEDEGLLATESILQEGHTTSVTFAFLLRSGNNGGETTDEEFGGLARIDQTLDLFIDELFLPSLPTLIDLDPDDVNPDTVEYILPEAGSPFAPQHGQLTPNQWHDDVFTYTPDPGFVGQDSFSYVVRDEETGEQSVGQVDLYVNVPPPVTNNGDNSRNASQRRQAERRSRD